MILFMSKERLRELIDQRAHRMLMVEEKCKKYEATLNLMHDELMAGPPIEGYVRTAPQLRDVLGMPFPNLHEAFALQRSSMRQAKTQALCREIGDAAQAWNKRMTEVTEDKNIDYAMRHLKKSELAALLNRCLRILKAAKHEFAPHTTNSDADELIAELEHRLSPEVCSECGTENPECGWTLMRNHDPSDRTCFNCAPPPYGDGKNLKGDADAEEVEV